MGPLNENPVLAYFQKQIEVNANLKRVESAKALPDFSFWYFNQSLIGSPIDAMAPIWQQPKSLQGPRGYCYPVIFGSYQAKIRSAAEQRNSYDDDL
jgi:cobalt-zinc-cadmium resistance protein CzcA